MPNDAELPETITAENGEQVPDGDQPMEKAVDHAQAVEHRDVGTDEQSNGKDDVA